VIVSPLFIPEGGTMTFRVGGGSGDQTRVALYAPPMEKRFNGRAASTAR